MALTKSQTIQFADNFTWIKGRHTMKFGVDVRRVAYQDLESFGGADDFGAFTFDQGIFTGNAFANLLLGLPTKTYVAQSGPDVHAHTIQTGVYAQDEFRVNDRLTLTYGLRWQALPAFVSDLGNLTAFDIRNGGIILPVGNQPRPGFLATINSCNPADPNNPADPCGTPTAADTALGCVPVLGADPNMPCAPVEYANKVGLGPGLRQFYGKNFQPRLGFAYRPFGNSKTVVRGGFGIFTMTNLGQLSFNTTNIDVSVVRTTANSFINGQPAYQFPSARTQGCSRRNCRHRRFLPKHAHQLPRPAIRAVESHHRTRTRPRYHAARKLRRHEFVSHESDHRSEPSRTQRDVSESQSQTVHQLGPNSLDDQLRPCELQRLAIRAQYARAQRTHLPGKPRLGQKPRQHRR